MIVYRSSHCNVVAYALSRSHDDDVHPILYPHSAIIEAIRNGSDDDNHYK